MKVDALNQLNYLKIAFTARHLLKKGDTPLRKGTFPLKKHNLRRNVPVEISSTKGLICRMSIQSDGCKELNEIVLVVGKVSLDLIQRFLSGRISREEMMEGLAGLRINEVLTKYWGELTSDAKYVPHWNVLQTLQGVVDEMAYQLAEYGDSTLFDDLKDIATCLKRITDQNNER